MSVLKGDCRELFAQFIPAGTVDLILTDPPFGISNRKNDSGASAAFSGYSSDKGDWDTALPVEEWLPECVRVLRPGGLIAVFGVFGSLVPIFQYLMAHPEMKFQTHITWHKTNPAPSIHRRMLTFANEIILVFSKGGKWTFDYDYGKAINNGKQLHNHFDCAAVQKIAGVTTKPHVLCTSLVRLFSREGDLVLDPFAGSGAIPRAAKLANRRWVAMEIDPICVQYMEATL